MIFGLVFIIALLGGQTGALPTIFEEDASALGYPCEHHLVKTSDGFILALFRIQAKGSQKDESGKLKSGRPVVLLAHGLDEIADVYIINSEDKSLGYLLANQGYDVWLMNNRGTAYSRQHHKYSISDSELWDYSFQEMASIDVPEVLDYITLTTKQEKLVAIGHSQGSTQFIAAMADAQVSKSVQAKLHRLIGISPVPAVSDVHERTNLIYNLITYYIPFRNFVGINYPLFSSNTRNWFKNAIRTLCSYSVTTCEGIMWLPGLLADNHCPKALGRLLEVLPGGASFRSYAHFEQLRKISLGYPVLRKFDFESPEENSRRYGAAVPPDYDYTLISTPLFFHSGRKDTLSTPAGLEKFAAHIRSMGKTISLTFYDDWDHFSPLISHSPEAAFANIMADVAASFSSSN